ncbi:nuclear GTP-binding protein [Nematocida displodere]|uniref:Nuclear GTP-binding protein n=1 Tax=Nematocida displodere TaxID=1805483 RepID=A0A177EF17_9MICR|nr:nuclear GTP-binding protein [Nematocida displodere]
MVAKKRLSKRVPTKRREMLRKKESKQNRETRRAERKKDKRQDGMPYGLIKTAEELQTLKEIREKAELRQKLYLERQKSGETAPETPKEDLSRRYLKDIYKLVKECDVIIEILDARDPLGSRTSAIEKIVLEHGKKLVMIINKVDLVERENWSAWLTYLRTFAPTVPFKASTQNQRTNIGQTEKTELKAEAYGVKDLMSLLKNYARGGGSVTVGIVGCPNVGKSSIINSLKRGRSCEVGNTPGVTKNLQHLVLDSSIRLVDSPGIIYKQNNPISNALRACTSDVDPEDIASLIFREIPGEDLAVLYGIQKPTSHEDLLILLALKWGKLGKKGNPDKRVTSFMLLRDLQQGRIKFCTPVPQLTTNENVISEITQTDASVHNYLPEGDDSLIRLSIPRKTLSTVDAPFEYESMPQ